MARVQVNYNGRSEELRTVAAPTIAAVQARFDRNGSGAMQLAEALGATGPLLEKLSQRVNEEEQKRAASFASGMTVEELGKAVRNGEVLASQSPIFRATVEHIYGENLATRMTNELNTRLENGETFGSTDEMDQFLIKKRVDALSGQSQYAVAGFDKQFNQIRERAIAANEKAVSKKLQERAIAEANDKFFSIYNLASQDPNITPEQRIALIQEAWQAYRRDGLLGNTESQRTIMMNLLQQAAQNKDAGFIDRMLEAKLSDGITVRSFIKPDKALQLYKQIDAAETAEYYRGLRIKNEQTDALEQAIVDTLEKGGDPKALENDSRFSSINSADRIKLIDGISRTWRKYNGVDQPFPESQKTFILSQFEGIEDPEEAQRIKFDLLGKAESALERSFIREAFNNSKFSNPTNDPAFRFGKGVVQSAHKTTDFFIGSDTYGPAYRGYQQAWQENWYLSPKELYERHKDVIPEEYKNRPLARMPLKIKNELADKIAKPFLSTATSGKTPDVSENARPAAPESARTLQKGETIKQGSITIKKTSD